MIKRILVPTDFSKHSHNAFKFAEELASQSNAEVHIYHVIEAPSASYSEGSFNAEGQIETSGSHEEIVFTKSLVSKVKQKIHKLASEARHDHVKFHSHVEMGDVFRSIVGTAEDHNMDVMVIGTQGAHGLGEVLVGSTAEKLVRHSPIPVIAVKDDVDLSLRNIVFASEFNEDLSKVMPIVKQIQKLFGSKLHLVRVNTPNDFHSTRTMKHMMEEFVKKYDLDNYTINTYSDIVEEDGIVYFAEDIDADMVIIPTHARKGLMHLLSGSIAEDVVNHAKRPVMTIKI